MDCPRCGSGVHCRNGIIQCRQRYRCKQCRYNYTVAQSSYVKPPETRHLALDLYLEGMGFRAIGRILKVSNTAVLGWVKQAGSSIAVQPHDELVEVVEVDEMHTYVGQKKVTAGFGLP